MNISRKSCTENHDTWQGRDGHPSVFLLGGSSYLFVFYLVRVRDGHHFSHCNGFWEGVAKLFVFLFGGRGHLPTFYLGRDGHSLILPFGGAGNLTPFNLGRDGHLFIWKGWPFIYLGRDCHLLFDRWWETIHLYNWEGMVIYLPMHVGGTCHLSTFLFGKGWLSICPFIWEWQVPCLSKRT